MPVDRTSPLKARAQALCQVLPRVYPDAHCELNFSNPLQLLIATMLSAQCTDLQVNKVTPELFRAYPFARDYARAKPAEMETAIRRIGLYRSKAKNIIAACQMIVELHGGEVPATLDELVNLPGVGRKTANVVLGNAFGENSGVVVDTHVTRLSYRLGLTRQVNPVKIEQVLIRLIPREHWTIFSHWLIFHGRRLCKALNPDCPHCEIKGLCPSFPNFMRLYEKKGKL